MKLSERAAALARGLARPKLIPLAFFFLTAGCSSGPVPASIASSGETASDAQGMDAAALCDPTYNPDTIAPGLTKPGASGAFTFVLESVDPIPPVPRYNNWKLRLIDRGGNAVSDATFPMIKTWMPLHMHGSSVVPTWMSNGDGTYGTSVFLFMTGLWQVTFHAQSAVTADSVTYTFCVGG